MSSGRARDLPQGWAEKPLGEIVELLDSRRVPVSTEEREKRAGSVPYYGATQQVGWIDEPIFDEPLLLVSEDGSHFLQAASTKAYMVDGPSWVNNHAHVVRANEELVRRPYLNYYLNHLDYSPHINGTTRQKLTKRALEAIPVPVPPIEEQDEIVAVLDRLLALVTDGDASLRRATDAAEAYRSTTLRAVLTGSMPALAPDVAEALRTAPRRPLKSLAGIRYGYTAKGTDEAVGPRMLRITDIQDGEVDWSAVPYCEIADEDRGTYRLAAGDVVFARLGFTTGKSYLIGQDVPDAVYASYLIRVRASDELIPDFLALYFQSSEYWAYVFSKRQGIDRPALNGSILGALEVPVPPRWAQEVAVDVAQRHLATVRAMALSLEAKSAEAQHLRTSLLHQAFIGGLNREASGHSVQNTSRAVLVGE